jgi:DNA-binding MarR family transcriptional regulator
MVHMQVTASEANRLTAANDTAPSSTIGCTCFRVRKAARRVTQLYDHYLADAGLRITQFSLLSHLRSAGPLTMTELADRMAMDRTTLTRNLRPLQRQAFVAIAIGDDRRRRLLTLTPTGERAYKSGIGQWQKAQRAVLEELGSDTVSELHRLLERTAKLGAEMLPA